MKFSINKKLVFEFSQWQIDLVTHYINGATFKEDMIRRSIYSVENPVKKYVNTHKESLKEELRERGITDIPGTLNSIAESMVSKDELDECKEVSLECDGQEFKKIPKYILIIADKFLNQKIDFGSYTSNRIMFIFREKINRSLLRMHFEWDEKLSSEGISIPVADGEFVNLVLSKKTSKKREILHGV